MASAPSSFQSLPDPPHPRALPLVGNLPEMGRMGMLPFFSAHWRRHGDVFTVQAGPRRMVVVVDPEGVEQVLVNRRENYVKGPTYDGMRLLTGNGLLTLEGDEWKTRRRLEQPAFHRAGIARLVETMARCTQAALERWRQRLPSGGTLEAHHEMMRLTLEIVGETLFGQAVGDARADISGAAFAEALQQVTDRGNSVVQLPLAFPTPSNRRFRRAISLLDELTHGVIRTGRSDPESAHKATLLHVLIHARDDETGRMLEDTDLRNEVVTLFLAGHETTALTLTWAFTLLGRHPEVVERMRDEVKRVLGDRVPTMEDCVSLTYVRQVIDEVLRLRSPVWTVARDAVADDEIRGYRVRPRDVVMPMTFLAHRHPAHWPDPDRFDPSRFEPDQVRTRPRGAYFPFSLGPRICIGKEFSLVETTLVLAMLLQRAEFSLLSTAEVVGHAAVTLRPAVPVPINLRWLN